MGVTTIVALQDPRRGFLKFDAHPSPHIYPLDVAGSMDSYSFLMSSPRWSSKVKNADDSVDLDEPETKAQIEDLARLGTRAILLGHELTADKTKFIIAESHRLGLVTYGEFIATPYSDALNDGVDSLLHMSRYELGLIPSRLQEPLVRDPEGAALGPAYAYLRQMQPSDPSVAAYAKQISIAGPALMPTLSLSYLQLPNHRNLWKEPAASILDPKGLHLPSDPATGEATVKYSPDDARRLTTKDDAQFFAINRALQVGHAPNLTGTGSPAFGTMPGISMHTELELLVRLGLTPREALAAATSNYSDRFAWHELGLVETGRKGRPAHPRSRPYSRHHKFAQDPFCDIGRSDSRSRCSAQSASISKMVAEHPEFWLSRPDGQRDRYRQASLHACVHFRRYMVFVSVDEISASRELRRPQKRSCARSRTVLCFQLVKLSRRVAMDVCASVGTRPLRNCLRNRVDISYKIKSIRKFFRSSPVFADLGNLASRDNRIRQQQCELGLPRKTKGW